MKRLAIILSFLLSADLSSAQSVALMKQLGAHAQVAVVQFFVPSGRTIEKMAIQGYSRLNSLNNYYLVDVSVLAQSPYTTKIVEYHCGVFLKKVSAKWQTQHTECEALN